MPECCHINGYAVKDAEARRMIGMMKTPELSEEQKEALYNLAIEYKENRAAFKYDNTVVRNIYASTECYDSDGKVLVNCGLFAGLVWAGVDVSTFTVERDNYTAAIHKKFDWGHYFDYPNRKASKVTKSDGQPYGFRKPNDDTLEGSYSNNSYYSENVDNEYKQFFHSFMCAADMANELFVKGCEIPISKADVGDLIFFNTARTHNGSNDGFEQFVFRSITHVGIILEIERERHRVYIAESTNALGSNYSIVTDSSTTVDNASFLHNINLMNHVAMVARHPAAFGMASAVPDKFTAI